MQHDYTHSYLALDLPPGSEWRDIRAAYRTLVKKWHPDRFPNDVPKRKLAEEKIKEITGAYRVLEEHYQKYGFTPLKPTPAAAHVIARPTTEQPPIDDRTQGIRPSAPTRVHEPASRSRRKTMVTMLLVATILSVIYLVSEEDTDSVAPTASHQIRPTTSEANLPMGSTLAPPAGTDHHFTIGSSLGEVYSIQGLPSKTEGDIWHYGHSTVYFTKGTVSNWQSHPDNPLKASHSAPDTAIRHSFFSYGATKTEVRTAQGTPSRETETLWEYGTSKIYFKSGKVTGWHESPLYPLKVAR